MPNVQPREQEAKFQVCPELLPALQADSLQLDGYAVRPFGVREQTDTYFDTPAFDLLRHGLTLRVRQGDSSNEVGIKSLEATYKGAVQERLDVAFPLPAGVKPLDVATWPKAVQQQLRIKHNTFVELRPLAVIRQQRQKSHLFAPTGHEPFAEWSLDKVWVCAASGGVDVQPDPFYELEIELLDQGAKVVGEDRAASFMTLVTHVQETFALSPIYTSKAVRGLASALAFAHQGAHALTPTMSLAAGCRLLLHQQLLAIMLNEDGVRRGEKAIFVHEMRVAIRRARAAILFFGHALPLGALKPYGKWLRRLGRILGNVRDLDVALANLRQIRRSYPPDQHKGLKALRAHLKKRRTHAHAGVVEILDSKKYRRFIADFNAFCAMPEDATQSLSSRANAPTTFEFPPSQVRHTVPSIILRLFESVRAYEVAFEGPFAPPLETFHMLRIRCKYLRYLLEFVQHLLDEPGTRLIDQLRLLQEELGRLNDVHVEQIRTQGWIEQLSQDAPLRMALEARQAHNAALIAELTTALPPRFAEFISHANRRQLGTVLARL